MGRSLEAFQPVISTLSALKKVRAAASQHLFTCSPALTEGSQSVCEQSGDPDHIMFQLLSLVLVRLRPSFNSRCVVSVSVTYHHVVVVL